MSDSDKAGLTLHERRVAQRVSDKLYALMQQDREDLKAFAGDLAAAIGDVVGSGKLAAALQMRMVKITQDGTTSSMRDELLAAALHACAHRSP